MLKNNIELDVKVKCIEGNTTQAKVAEIVGTTPSYVSRIQDYCLRGVIYVGLNINLLNKYVLFLPSIEEQNQIVEYLDRKCSEIDKEINRRRLLIEKLQEYRRNLIYEVVTGKKEVV